MLDLNLSHIIQSHSGTSCATGATHPSVEAYPHDSAGSTFSHAGRSDMDDLLAEYIPLARGILSYELTDDDDEIFPAMEIGALGMLLGSVAHDLSYKGDLYRIDPDVFPDRQSWEGTQLEADAQMVVEKLEEMILSEGEAKLEINMQFLDQIRRQLADIETIYRHSPSEDISEAIELMLNNINADMDVVLRNKWEMPRTCRLLFRAFSDIYERALRYRHSNFTDKGELADISFLAPQGAEPALPRAMSHRPRLPELITWGEGAWERTVEMGFVDEVQAAVKKLEQREPATGRFLHPEVIPVNSGMKGLGVYKVRKLTNGKVRFFVQVRRGLKGEPMEIRVLWCGNLQSERSDYAHVEKLARANREAWDAEDATMIEVIRQAREHLEAERARQQEEKRQAIEEEAKHRAEEAARHRAEQAAKEQARREAEAEEKKARLEKKKARRRGPSEEVLARKMERKERKRVARAEKELNARLGRMIDAHVEGYASLDSDQANMLRNRLSYEMREGFLTWPENIDGRTGEPKTSAAAEALGFIMAEVSMAHPAENLSTVAVRHPYGYTISASGEQRMLYEGMEICDSAEDAGGHADAIPKSLARVEAMVRPWVQGYESLSYEHRLTLLERFRYEKARGYLRQPENLDPATRRPRPDAIGEAIGFIVEEMRAMDFSGTMPDVRVVRPAPAAGSRRATSVGTGFVAGGKPTKAGASMLEAERAGPGRRGRLKLDEAMKDIERAKARPVEGIRKARR